MEGIRTFDRIKIQNLLSFDEEGIDLELQPLNVLVGPNGSGKSNFLDVIGLLPATASDITLPFRSGGGIAEWMPKGLGSQSISQVQIAIGRTPAFEYGLSFKSAGAQFELVDETIWIKGQNLGSADPTAERTYSYRDKDFRLFSERQQDKNADRALSSLLASGDQPLTLREKVKQIYNQSIFSVAMSPDDNAVIYVIGLWLTRIRLYRDWNIRRDSEAALPQRPDEPHEFLSENGDNLAVVMNDILKNTSLHDKFVDGLKMLNPRIREVQASLTDQFVQIYVREEGLKTLVPATRLSDGTMRLMCLLTILLHPKPPMLICIEEPELGLHPDMIHKVAELLKDAATRTQLIVTTHSDLLVSALSDVPEAIVVCEHDGSGTRMTRLDASNLKEWLKDYSLGDLWLKGEIGGT